VTNASVVAILKAHLDKEGLVLCRPNDTQFPLDGFKEVAALTEIVELVEEMNTGWDDVTKPIPAAMLDTLRAA
jgi:hypothetical protein